jgi:hypothetical protein
MEKELTEMTEEELRKEYKSIGRRLKSALKQRDEWAVKYANLKEKEKDWKILEKNTCTSTGFEL